VLNLEESVAVTQNYVSQHNVKNVERFLSKKKNKEVHSEFVAKLKEHQPALMEEIDRQKKKEQTDKEERERLKKESSIWTKLKSGTDATSTAATENSFSFSFNFDE